LALTVSAGLVQYEAENTAELDDGQGNPPDVTTGTPWLANTADEVVLLQLPETLDAPVVVESAMQVLPSTLAVQWTAFCGMVRLDVPPEDTHRFQVPLVVQVAAKLKKPALTVQLLRVGAVIAPQIGCPCADDVALPLVDDVLQFTVAVPSLKVALVPVHNEAVKAPAGETASANAG